MKVDNLEEALIECQFCSLQNDLSDMALEDIAADYGVDYGELKHAWETRF